MIHPIQGYYDTLWKFTIVIWSFELEITQELQKHFLDQVFLWYRVGYILPCQVNIDQEIFIRLSFQGQDHANFYTPKQEIFTICGYIV